MKLNKINSKSGLITGSSNLKQVEQQKPLGQQNSNYQPNSPTIVSNQQITPDLVKLEMAIGILNKNKLPLLPQLIEGLTLNFSKEKPITAEVQKLLTASKKERLNPISKTKASQQLTNLLNRLLIKPDRPPEKLAALLNKYGQEVNNLLELLFNSKGQTQQKLAFQLLGQQLLNSKELTYQQSASVLSLELPLSISDHSKLLPLYLQIKKNSQNQQQNKKARQGYTISLLIELERLGLISADLTVNTDQKQIISTFYTSSTETTRLLDKKIPLLKNKLENLGYKAAQPVIKQLQPDDQQFDVEQQFSPEKEGAELLKHIDIFV